MSHALETVFVLLVALSNACHQLMHEQQKQSASLSVAALSV